MTGMLDHGFGCTCRDHVDRAWRRSEHWTRSEVEELEAWYGRISDQALSVRLGRSVTAIILKKRRLGLHKKDRWLTAHDVAEIFGVDPTTVTKKWIARRLLRSHRGWLQGPRRVHLVSYEALERFIRDHGQYVDVDKMPDSPYRALALKHRFYSVPEVVRLTGRHPHALTKALLQGRYRGAKRGSHWFIPADELPLLATRAHLGPMPPTRIASLAERTEQRLERRRNERKGVAA